MKKEAIFHIRNVIRGVFRHFLYTVTKGEQKMPEINALAKRVKAYRESLKKTQFEFSGEIGINADELSLIEREKANPSLGTLQKIAAYMGITVSALLEVGEGNADGSI